MTINQEVWTGLDADVDVYLEDENGDAITSGGTVITYCYWQNFSVRALLEQVRRPVTGRSRKKIVNRAYEYEASVDHFYFRKSDELNLTEIFNREQPLQFVVRMRKEYQTSEEGETHTLKRAFANGFDITGQENDIIIASAKFSAEDFE